MKCRNCLSSFENRRSTRNKIYDFMHSSMFTVFYSHKVWTWYCRVVCRTVRGSEWESYRHWRNVRTPSQSLSSLVLRRLYTLAWPSRDTSDTSLSFIFWAVYLFVHRSTNIISEVLKVNIFFAARYMEYGARIHYQDQDNAADNMWR